MDIVCQPDDKSDFYSSEAYLDRGARSLQACAGKLLKNDVFGRFLVQASDVKSGILRTSAAGTIDRAKQSDGRFAAGIAHCILLPCETFG